MTAPVAQPSRRALYALLGATAVIIAVGAGYLTFSDDPASGVAQPSTSAPAKTSTSPGAPPADQSDPQQTTTAPDDGSGGDGSGGGTGAPPPVQSEPQITVAGPSLPERVIEFVEDYYDLLPEDTDAAWELLSPKFQSMGRGSYIAFWGGIQDVSVGDMVVDGQNLSVTYSITYTRKSGQTINEQQQLTLIENGESFLIDSQT